jgi:hypothetical protein
MGRFSGGQEGASRPVDLTQGQTQTQTQTQTR